MSFSEGNRRYVSYVGGSSNPIKTGSIYRGTVTNVSATGMVRVRIPDLGNQVTKYAHALRGPETNPYLVDDQVLCIFLNNELSELFVLGRFNYKIDVTNPEFNLEDITLWSQTTRHATTYRHTGINIHDPQFPLHIGGQTRQWSPTMKIEPTEYPGSYKAGIDLDRTGITSGGNTGYRGDFGVYDGHNPGYTLYSSGYFGTDGGHTGNAADSYFLIGGGSGGDGRTTPAGEQKRSIYFYPSMGGHTKEIMQIYWTGSNDGGYAFIALGKPTYFNNTVSPASWNNPYDLGDSDHRWQDIYLTNQPNVSSDENIKTDIVDSDLGLEFINGLRPVSFKFIDGGVRTHYGLIAQEVRDLLGDAASDTAIWTEQTFEAEDAQPEKLDPDGNVSMAVQPAVEEHTVQGLRYDELISPLIKAVQELTARVEALEGA